MPQPRVQSLDRALDLLEALADAGELGVSEIAARTGLVPSTAHRLLGTLVARGYASQNPATGRYRLGYKLLELTGGVQDRLARLTAAAKPHLEAIQARTGETTNLVVLEGRDVVYIESVSGTRSVRLHTEVGRSIPAHTSGAGKALLAWRDPVDVAALLDGAPLAPSTPHTLTTLDALQGDLAKIRKRGYATDDEEHELGVTCVATPILDDAGVPLAAISVSGPAPRMTDAGGLAALLREHAEQVAKELLGR
ncbi:MAG TPA: IclR family transcriptional regulator [Solirubrobacter sp.]|nr:IclR family transcriptional regulator [Solirubrobacter sp.]